MYTIFTERFEAKIYFIVQKPYQFRMGYHLLVLNTRDQKDDYLLIFSLFLLIHNHFVEFNRLGISRFTYSCRRTSQITVIQRCSDPSGEPLVHLTPTQKKSRVTNNFRNLRFVRHRLAQVRFVKANAFASLLMMQMSMGGVFLLIHKKRHLQLYLH